VGIDSVMLEAFLPRFLLMGKSAAVKALAFDNCEYAN